MSSEVPVILLIIALPLYFFFVWRMKKKQVGSRRWYTPILLALALSPLVYGGIIFLWVWSASWYIPSDFDQKEWLENSEERYRMSGDLIDSEMLIGLDTGEVKKLLGNDVDMNFGRMTYYLGFSPGFIKIDPDWLEIYFENGKVVRVEEYSG